MASTNTSVIVFGSTGAIGTSLIELLSKEHPDWQIKAVTRSISSKSRLAEMGIENVTMVEGDPFSKEDVLSLTKDCEKIYCCVGFHKYETKYWAVNWPLVVDNLLAATVAGDQKRQLIFCDNLYAYGPGSNISEKTPTIPPSLKTKPAIRSMLRQNMLEHMKAHPGTLTVIGAADFFGPHLTETSLLGDLTTGKIMAGESPMALCSASVIHDFCFAPDFAKAMAIASVSEKAYDKFWICPHSVHGKTMTEIANDIAKVVNGNKAPEKPVKVTALPAFALAILGVFQTLMAELYQMRNFWNSDYTIDDSSFRREFGVEATPYDEALDSVVGFYRQNQKVEK
ncbi:NAD-dependent epimerase dehydratase [Seminavis robusta]|uniref:NAD-dependent epimerase dehydratase n=1 Tax=Seminavis robusta TaxID=568900 RepID=A0A9N8HIA9_9STRA|nr:NAD-dependent epimerase dehydratase [Seminavis robusta]|eukprot:Sro583_g170660.1 NAD-dependent epimerase dehydratase (340) ;mRNA; f:35581-36600